MIKACVFDMDGTVLDTISTITHFVNVTLSEFGIEGITEEECKYFVGNGARILIERTFASKGISDKELFEKVLSYYVRAYDENPIYKTAPFENMLTLLEELRKMGIKTACVSNKPHDTVVSLAKHFFADRFDVVFGARNGVPLKPQPDAVLEALDKMGVPSEEMAYIGDTGVDMQTGNNAKAALVIGVLWGFRKEDELRENGADVIVNETLQILEEVKKLA